MHMVVSQTAYHVRHMSDATAAEDQPRVTFRMLSREAHTVLLETALEADMPVGAVVRLAIAELLARGFPDQPGGLWEKASAGVTVHELLAVDAAGKSNISGPRGLFESKGKS